MQSFWDQWIVGPMTVFLRDVGQFLPRLLIFVFLLALGFLLGFLLQGVLGWILRRARLDDLSRKTGISALLQRIGVTDPLPRLIGRIAFGFSVLIFSILALGSLDIRSAGGFLERFFLYLPNVFAAAFILVAGALLASFLHRAVLIAAVNAGWKTAGWIAKGVQVTLIVLVAVMALEQLGIGRGALLVAFAIGFGGVMLALALAFGLGGRDLARRYLEKKFGGGEPEKDDLKHL